MNYSLISKKFKPSIISDLLEIRDDSGNLIKRCRDVALVRKEQNYLQSCDYEKIKAYVNSQLTPAQSQQFSNDEEAFRSILPRSVDNPTMVYQYSKYLKSHFDEKKSEFNKIKDSRVRAQYFYDKFINNNNNTNKDDNK